MVAVEGSGWMVIVEGAGRVVTVEGTGWMVVVEGQQQWMDGRMDGSCGSRAAVEEWQGGW